MKTRVGLWIDHRKAVIVFVAGEEEEIKLISSDIESSADNPAGRLPADDTRQRELTGHLNSYYDEVILSLRECESLV
jgi:hypothetical protein